MKPATRLPREEWPRLLAEYDFLDPKLAGGWVKSARRSYLKAVTGLTVSELRKEIAKDAT